MSGDPHPRFEASLHQSLADISISRRSAKSKNGRGMCYGVREALARQSDLHLYVRFEQNQPGRRHETNVAVCTLRFRETLRGGADQVSASAPLDLVAKNATLCCDSVPGRRRCTSADPRTPTRYPSGLRAFGCAVIIARAVTQPGLPRRARHSRDKEITAGMSTMPKLSIIFDMKCSCSPGCSLLS